MKTIATLLSLADRAAARRLRRAAPTCASILRRSTVSTPSRCSAARATSSTTASTATARSTCATSASRTSASPSSRSRTTSCSATDKIGSTMTVAMTPAEGKAWFGAVPPDLSVEARVRGADWLYNYLLAFYRDDSTTTGWNNLVFPNVGMPHVLWQAVGPEQARVRPSSRATRRRSRPPSPSRGSRSVEPAAGGKWVVRTVTPDPERARIDDARGIPGVRRRPRQLHGLHGRAHEEQARSASASSSCCTSRVLFVLVYALKRMYWKDVH